MKEKVKTIIGNFLIAIYPKRASKLSREGMTISWNNKLSIKDRLIRNTLLKKAEKGGDFDTLAEFHRNYWVERGTEHFSNVDNALHGFFRPKCEFLFDHLKKLLKGEPNNFKVMVEIGTGNGDVLDYLSTKFTEIDRFVGIDLSPDQIERNRLHYAENPKLEFIASDGFEWIKENGAEEMIFFTSGGVLEYFTQKRLQEVLEYVNHLGPAIFVAIEPIGTGIDFTENPNSQAYGPERSFSHNYVKLFAEAGFTIWHESQIPCEGVAWNFWAIGAKN